MPVIKTMKRKKYLSIEVVLADHNEEGVSEATPFRVPLVTPLFSCSIKIS
jgi:hypothetical protein